MLRKLLVVGLIGYGVYYYYHIAGQPEPRYSVDNFGNIIEIPPVQVVEEKDLQKVKDVAHTKDANLLYDTYGNERVKIHHTFTTQVMKNATL